jgi:hypothetical protein
MVPVPSTPANLPRYLATNRHPRSCFSRIRLGHVQLHFEPTVCGRVPDCSCRAVEGIDEAVVILRSLVRMSVLCGLRDVALGFRLISSSLPDCVNLRHPRIVETHGKACERLLVEVDRHGVASYTNNRLFLSNGRVLLVSRKLPVTSEDRITAMKLGFELWCTGYLWLPTM